jgi:small subunit ribosomal protein S9
MPTKTTSTKTASKKTSAPEADQKETAQTRDKSEMHEYFYAAGKRKTAIARVRLYPKGKGIITVNDKPLTEYFKLITSMGVITSPLKLSGLTKDFDISVKVEGGGTSAQADAIRHGISKALLTFNDNLRTTLKKAGFLTRDARIKERKKPGLKRARRAPQFSKR